MNRFREALRAFGTLNGLLYLLHRAGAQLAGNRLQCHRYYLVAQPLNRPMPRLRRMGSDITVRQVPHDSAEVRDFPRPDAVIAARYAIGSTCLAAYRDERFVGFIWLVNGPYEEDEVRCRYVPLPASRTCWDYDLYVEPEFRTGIALVKLWSEAMAQLRAQGIQWSLSRISAYSPGSLASHKRMGASILGSAIFFRFGRVQLMLATVAPWIHFGHINGKGPELQLNAPIGNHQDYGPQPATKPRP